jgi:hypothetical protein
VQIDQAGRDNLAFDMFDRSGLCGGSVCTPDPR